MVNKKTGSKAVAKSKPVKTVMTSKPEQKKVVKKSVVATSKKATTAKVSASKPVAKVVAKKAVVAKPAPKPVVVQKARKPVSASVAKAAKNNVPVPAQKSVSPAKAAALKPATATPVKKAAKDKGQGSSLVTIIKKAAPIIKKEPQKVVKITVPKTTAKAAVKYQPEFTKSILDKNNYNPETETGPIMRYSDVDLVEFKEIIARKLDAAKKELAYLQGLITRRDDIGDMDEARYMTLEDGSVSMEREQLSQMASRQINFIDHLEKAMMRIENKTYGVCRISGRLIDKARLKAVPHATLSIEAKQMMNR